MTTNGNKPLVFFILGKSFFFLFFLSFLFFRSQFRLSSFFLGFRFFNFRVLGLFACVSSFFSFSFSFHFILTWLISFFSFFFLDLQFFEFCKLELQLG